MSESALSQNELDALLGNDDVQSVASNQDSENLNQAEKQALGDLFSSITSKIGNTLTDILNKKSQFNPPDVTVISRDEFLGEISGKAVEFQSAFQGGISGAHLHVISADDALNIAVHVIGQDDLDLNETAINAVGEAVSQVNGILIAELEEKTGETLTVESAEGNSISPEELSLSDASFVQVHYKADIEDNGSINLREVFSLPLIKIITGRLLGASAGAGAFDDVFSSMLGEGGGQENTDRQSSGISQGMASIGGMGSGMPNVHGVQMPNLSPVNLPGDQKNLGILMDVSMELTVELGRTKWKIRDILAMGEGTIIELDKLAGEPVDILVNSNLLAKGEVVVIDENFGVRVTEIITTIDRIQE